jgi:hypothetical protein
LRKKNERRQKQGKSAKTHCRIELQLQRVKTKLSCETSLKTWKLKMWKRSFRARSSHPHLNSLSTESTLRSSHFHLNSWMSVTRSLISNVFSYKLQYHHIIHLYPTPISYFLEAICSI